MSTEKTIFVTGIGGFVGSNMVKIALEEGYKVKGSMREKTKAKWEPFLREKLGEKESNLTVVALDLVSSTDDEWCDALKGCSYLIHTASPFPVVQPEDENELIKPAVEGTRKMLLQAHRAGIKRVSVTSSVITNTTEDKKEKGAKFTPDDWVDPEKSTHAYQRSKIFAEKEAWKIAEEKDLELTTVLPSAILGPLLLPRDCSSTILSKRFLKGEFPLGLVPPLGLNFCDVRDVCKAHLRAIEKDNCQGKRFICATGSILMTELRDIMLEEFKKDYPIPSSTAPYSLLWLVSFWDKQAKAVLGRWKALNEYDVSRTTDAENGLGMELTSLKDAMLSNAQSIIDLKLLGK